MFQHMTQFSSSISSISAFIAVITISFIPTVQLVVSAYSLKMLAAILEPIAFDDICRLLDHVSKSLFTLCAVSFLIAFSFMFSCFFSLSFLCRLWQGGDKLILLLALLFICQLFVFLTDDKQIISLTKLVITLVFLQLLLKIPFINS